MAKTVMIVDDSSSVRTVVRTALSSAGYEVIEAENGQVALDKLSGQKVHLIVSDVNMPVMDGITFVKEVKKLADYKFTPICMLTTENEGSKIQEGKDAGAKAWIVKPFQPPKLLDAVSKLIQP